MEAQQMHMIEHYISVYNAFNIANMSRDMHKEVIFQNVSNGEVDLETKGLSAFKERANKAKNNFSERKQKIMDVRYGSDSATVSIDYTGVLTVDLSEQMKAGDKLSLQGTSTFFSRDGQIIKIVDERWPKYVRPGLVKTNFFLPKSQIFS